MQRATKVIYHDRHQQRNAFSFQLRTVALIGTPIERLLLDQESNVIIDSSQSNPDDLLRLYKDARNGRYECSDLIILKETVDCDGLIDSGYETVIGYNDIKTAAGVYFYVTRNSTYTSTWSVIPYEVEHLNIGGAMHLETGVFTAPADGRYHFTFTGRANSMDWNSIQLRLNGSNIGVSGSASSGNNMPLSATLNLKKGDQVDTFLYAGVLGDDWWRSTHFSGILIEEDLSL